MRFHKRAAIVLIAALLLPLTAHAQAEIPAPEPHWAAKIFDAAIVRSMTLGGLAVGVALYIPAVILVAPSGKNNLKTATEHFVLEPFRATFVRPLGKLH